MAQVRHVDSAMLERTRKWLLERHDQLKELVKAEKIAAYEVLGRDLVLYWRAMPPEERIELPVSLVAATPGKYTAPASRAYLYYIDEHKTWVDGLTAQITPRD